MRIGHGYDAHRFGEGDAVVLGGVTIPHNQTLIAHSDGDVLVHALCDALLGALGLGDIGAHFPDSDAAYRDIDSRLLLRRVMERLDGQHHKVINVDATVIAQSPKLAPYIDTMRDNLASDLSIDSQRVNIKATTTEGMGFAGRGEGIAAHAVVLIDQTK